MMNLRFWKRIFSNVFAIGLAVFVSYYFSFSEKLWMPLAAIVAMQTSVGLALRQGMKRFLMMAIFVVIITLLFSSVSILYARLSDVFLGSLIGIFCNLMIFPRRVDVEFRHHVVPILQSYVDYLTAIVNLFFQKEHSKKIAEQEKIRVEHCLKMPDWIYESGLNVSMRSGHRHFLIMIERVGQILFSMHYIARHSIDWALFQSMRQPIEICSAESKKILIALITVLTLQKISSALNDFSEEITELEKTLQAVIPASELLDISPEYIYLIAFVAEVKDLRNTLLQLAQALM